MDVVREAPPAVDLDHRQPGAILGLERGIARDVDLPELEAQAFLSVANDLERPLAEVAALRVVDDDARRGYG